MRVLRLVRKWWSFSRQDVRNITEKGWEFDASAVGELSKCCRSSHMESERLCCNNPFSVGPVIYETLQSNSSDCL